jgi:hypothetical protein
VSAPDGSPLLLTHKRLHTRRLITLFGAVSVTRMGYGCPGQTSVHPLDAELELPARTYSYEIQRRLVKAAVQGPFDEAFGFLWDTTGVGVPKRSAEQIIAEAAVDFDSFYVQPLVRHRPVDHRLGVSRHRVRPRARGESQAHQCRQERATWSRVARPRRAVGSPSAGEGQLIQGPSPR